MSRNFKKLRFFISINDFHKTYISEQCLGFIGVFERGRETALLGINLARSTPLIRALKLQLGKNLVCVSR